MASEPMEIEIYSCGADEFVEKSIPEMIEWLQGIAAGQPFGPDEIKFQVFQDGDHWDGYSMARLVICRMETQEEAEQREADYERQTAARIAETEQRERNMLQVLKIKYER